MQERFGPPPQSSEAGQSFLDRTAPGWRSEPTSPSDAGQSFLDRTAPGWRGIPGSPDGAPERFQPKQPTGDGGISLQIQEAIRNARGPGANTISGVVNSMSGIPGANAQAGLNSAISGANYRTGGPGSMADVVSGMQEQNTQNVAQGDPRFAPQGGTGRAAFDAPNFKPQDWTGQLGKPRTLAEMGPLLNGMTKLPYFAKDQAPMIPKAQPNAAGNTRLSPGVYRNQQGQTIKSKMGK